MIPKRITTPTDPLWTQILETYTSAFPAVERRDVRLLPALLEGKSGFRSFALCHEEEYVGFMHFWEFSTFSYLEHFAIDSAIRQKGYGSRAISWLLEHLGDSPLLLEVEPPVDDLTRRRITFYERHGLHLLDTPYVQPPYRDTDEELPMLLMSTQEQLPDDGIRTLRRSVYGCTD